MEAVPQFKHKILKQLLRISWDFRGFYLDTNCCLVTVTFQLTTAMKKLISDSPIYHY